MSLSIGALIAAGAAGLIGQGINYGITQDNNRLQVQREDNAIQRRVQDLKKAGLNPLLAAGQGSSTGGLQSSTFDTSGLGNSIQSLFDLKNQRESYKQNQLYTKLLESQLRSADRAEDYEKLDYFSLFGHDSPDRFFNYSPTGRILPNVGSYITGLPYNPYKDSPADNYVNAFRNEQLFNFNQSAFNLKTQGYQNGLNLTKDTLGTVLDLASILNPISAGVRAFRGNRNYNFNTSRSYFRGDLNYTRNY